MKTSTIIFVSTAISIGFLLALWLLNNILIGKSKSILDYFKGKDGRASTSKFQFFVFTFAFVFAFVLIHTFIWFVTRHFVLIDNIPKNVLLAMGFSGVTFVGAKAITVTQISTGKLSKPDISDPKPVTTGAPAVPPPSTQPVVNSWTFLVTDDDGNLDFSKFQMLIWTLIAVTIFIINAYQIICDLTPPKEIALLKGYKMPTPTLPDINDALMVLMGLGQGAYLGKKLVLAPTPRLTGISVAVAAAADMINPTIQIIGGDFGGQQAGSQILFDGMPLPPKAVVKTWSASAITFDPGPNHPNGTALKSGQIVQVSLLINGIASSNTLPFTF